MSDIEYEVEDILMSRVDASSTMFLVKWKGYPEDDATWETIDNLENSSKVLDRFLASVSERVERLTHQIQVHRDIVAASRLELEDNSNKFALEEYRTLIHDINEYYAELAVLYIRIKRVKQSSLLDSYEKSYEEWQEYWEELKARYEKIMSNK